MKAKTAVGLCVGCLLFSLCSSVMIHIGQAQQLTPMPMPVTKIVWDYDSGWVKINPGADKELMHYLGGDPREYFVYVVGTSNPTYPLIHQSNYGTNYEDSNERYGLKWYECLDDRIIVERAFDDLFAGDDEEWNYVRVRILKNQ
jgi:hypothetical protein